MKKTLKDTAGQFAFIAAAAGIAAACALCGCSVKKIEYARKDTGEVSYRIYENDHWLKMSGSGLRGGMTKNGDFSFSADGLEKSPSEEFNRTMQTYMGAFVQIAQIVAAAYNPSASTTLAASQTSQTPQTSQTSTTNDCVDCVK